MPELSAPIPLSDIVVITLGRNSRRSSRLVEAALDALLRGGADLQRFECTGPVLSLQADEAWPVAVDRLFGPRAVAWLHRHRLPRKGAKAVTVLLQPRFWGYFRWVLFRDRLPVTELRRCLRKVARQGRRVLFVSHSAGGILGTRLDGEAVLLGHLCFGYPFRHPERGEESYRTRRLPGLRKPLTILQGEADPYGSAASGARYPLSSQVRLIAMPGDHDYDEASVAALDALDTALRGLLHDAGAAAEGLTLRAGAAAAGISRVA